MRPLRLLLTPSPPSARPQHTHLDITLSIAFTAVFFAGVTYILLNSVLSCLRRCRHHLQQPANGTVTVIADDPECRAQLQAIPVEIYTSCSSDGPDSCSVCLGEYEAGDEVRALPRCGHMFHRTCIDPWLITRSSFCPICRERVIERSVEPATTSCRRGGDDNRNNNRSGGRDVPELLPTVEMNIWYAHHGSML